MRWSTRSLIFVNVVITNPFGSVARLAHTSRTRVTAILNRNTQDISTDLMLRVLAFGRPGETAIQERRLIASEIFSVEASIVELCCRILVTTTSLGSTSPVFRPDSLQTDSARE